MTTQHSITELVSSLTGYEDQAIEDRFGRTIAQLLDANAIKACRALLFVEAKRRGVRDGDAYKQVMGMTISEVDSSFKDEAEDADDLNPDEPYTEQGKGDSTSDAGPRS